MGQNGDRCFSMKAILFDDNLKCANQNTSCTYSIRLSTLDNGRRQLLAPDNNKIGDTATVNMLQE